ncbi:MAG: ABC transporter ATP-binding protein [Clostridia bacterium]|nr:ABC transporter ATP-binding protein [Clostridia bacterium]
MSELLKVSNLCFGYDETPFLKDINFSVNAGELVSIIGENGSGKSTLFKVINGLFVNYNGTVIYNGKDIKQIRHIDKAREIAVLYQNCQCNFPFTCFDVIAMGLYPHKGKLGKLRNDDIYFIESIMELTDTIELADRNINCISGGQMQRVLLARALVQKPKLLFLDEAMSGMDIASRIKMTDIIINECKKRNTAVVNISHDINLAFEKSDKIVAIKSGEVHSFGTPKDLLNNKFFREVFNVEVEIDENKKYFRIIL